MTSPFLIFFCGLCQFGLWGFDRLGQQQSPVAASKAVMTFKVQLPSGILNLASIYPWRF